MKDSVNYEILKLELILASVSRQCGILFEKHAKDEKLSVGQAKALLRRVLNAMYSRLAED